MAWAIPSSKCYNWCDYRDMNIQRFPLASLTYIQTLNRWALNHNLVFNLFIKERSFIQAPYTYLLNKQTVVSIFVVLSISHPHYARNGFSRSFIHSHVTPFGSWLVAAAASAVAAWNKKCNSSQYRLDVVVYNFKIRRKI